MLSLTERPRKFKNIVGHDITIQTFEKYSEENTFPSVMMLSGPTGTGKTTTGNIIAMRLNCHNSVKENDTVEPCGKCKACQDIITETYNRDVKYYDASKMGKDDVLNLENEANKFPMLDTNKVIIIEEAQQLLSQGAKGALLKLIEKPRKNVYFILLTMDERKLDKAVITRCQMYPFRKHKKDVVAGYLFELLEKFDPDEKLPETFLAVLNLISENCDGSLRKAVQDFQRCVDAEIYTEELANTELGYLDENAMFKILLKLLRKDNTFFNDVRKYELVEYFNYTWKILLNIKEGSITGNFGGNQAKQKRAEAIIQTGLLDKLISSYNTIHESNSSYFNDNVFNYHMLKFFDSIQSEKKVSRRRRVKKE